MPASFDPMSFSGDPILILAGWSSLLGLILIFPGSMAAVARTFRGRPARLRRDGRPLGIPPLGQAQHEEAPCPGLAPELE